MIASSLGTKAVAVVAAFVAAVVAVVAADAAVVSVAAVAAAAEVAVECVAAEFSIAGAAATAAAAGLWNQLSRWMAPTRLQGRLWKHPSRLQSSGRTLLLVASAAAVVQATFVVLLEGHAPGHLAPMSALH